LNKPIVIIVFLIGDYVVFYLVGIDVFDQTYLFYATCPFAIVVLVSTHVLLRLGHDNESEILMQAKVAHSEKEN
jgi:hypothetical protein